jgi:hypothetical protein
VDRGPCAAVDLEGAEGEFVEVHTASLCCVQALFLEVMAEKEDQLCSTSGLPQCGQVGLSVSCSAIVSIFKKGLFAGVAEELIVGHTDLPQSLTLIASGF